MTSTAVDRLVDATIVEINVQSYRCHAVRPTTNGIRGASRHMIDVRDGRSHRTTAPTTMADVCKWRRQKMMWSSHSTLNDRAYFKRLCESRQQETCKRLNNAAPLSFRIIASSYASIAF